MTSASLILWASAALAAAPAAPHDAAFWKHLAETKFEIPEGEKAGDLLVEASALLGSPDPALRDRVAYEAAVDWILKKQVVEPVDLRRLLELWTPNLAKGVGETGGDGVLLRSFSALELSVLASRDVQSEWMTPEELKALLDAALAYLAAERDLRGYDAKKGWMHATGHTADLLKFLARNKRLSAADATRILSGISAKVRDAGEVFAWGEDERLASAALAVMRRGDVDPASWLNELGGTGNGLWEAPALDVKQYAATQNAKHLLARLHVLLDSVPEPPPALVEARAQVLAALEKLP